MSFKNILQSIIRKSNGDILYFYVENYTLFVKEFEFNIGWKDSVKLFENLDDCLFDMKIDSKNYIYGIAIPENGEILYFYSDHSNIIEKSRLFSYDNDKYNLMFPFVKQSDSTLHLIYFIQNKYTDGIWSLYSQYFDGNSWNSSNIDSIFTDSILQPFVATCISDDLNIFYFKNEEIFFCRFNSFEKSWSSPTQLTASSNKKLYLSVLQDNFNFFHITWSEYIDQNLVVRYTNGSFNKGFFESSETINLSNPSNCSYPTLVKTKDILWNMWVQFDKLYSCHSSDNGMLWSEPFIDSRSIDLDFMRYKFNSNCNDDLNNFKIDTIFGVFSPSISFIGFDTG